MLVIPAARGPLDGLGPGHPEVVCISGLRFQALHLVFLSMITTQAVGTRSCAAALVVPLPRALHGTLLSREGSNRQKDPPWTCGSRDNLLSLEHAMGYQVLHLDLLIKVDRLRQQVALVAPCWQA